MEKKENDQEKIFLSSETIRESRDCCYCEANVSFAKRNPSVRELWSQLLYGEQFRYKRSARKYNTWNRPEREMIGCREWPRVETSYR